jgi:hypothetical protein
MNGVEILSSETIYQTEANWQLIIICAGVGLGVSIFKCIQERMKNRFESADIVTSFIVVMLCALFGFALAVITRHGTDTIDYIEYKVTIDDSVSMNEFLDKYEILDQEGKIYTVKERE